MVTTNRYSSPDCEMIEIRTDSAVLQGSGVAPIANTSIENWEYDEALPF